MILEAQYELLFRYAIGNRRNSYMNISTYINPIISQATIFEKYPFFKPEQTANINNYSKTNTSPKLGLSPALFMYQYAMIIRYSFFLGASKQRKMPINKAIIIYLPFIISISGLFPSARFHSSKLSILALHNLHNLHIHIKLVQII